MVFIKIILILTLAYVLFQDVKERLVYWFLFPLTALCCGVLHYFNTLPELFYISVAINMAFTSILLLIVFLYAKIKLKTAFNQAFGLGDVLIFLALTFSFSSVSFIVLFICALLFSLLLHFALKKKNTVVPLAGYMCLFFGVVYLANWFDFINSLYSI